MVQKNAGASQRAGGKSQRQRQGRSSLSSTPYISDTTSKKQLHGHGHGYVRRGVSSVFVVLVGTIAFALALSAFSVYRISSILNIVEPEEGPLRGLTPQGRGSNRGNKQRTGGTSAAADACELEYDRATNDRTAGLSEESISRSRAWMGNRQRFDSLARTLTAGTDVHVVAFGGSITLGHGVANSHNSSYPHLLEEWLNDKYTSTRGDRRHRVYNMAAHGADMCALEKRINGILADLDQKGSHPDLFLLEFAVNDYQGQDHVSQVDSRTDVFFSGFQDLALCCEVVVHKLLQTKAAIAFLEFRTAVPSRKTGAFLHSGVAQHYEIPVLSYAEAVVPEYFHLVSLLNASDRYTVPRGETLLPYPHGCQPCHPAGIADSLNHFRPPDKHCRTVCDLMFYSGADCDMFQSPPTGRDYCHPAIFAVDAVHPSALGHEIAKDLIAHAIASAVRDVCRNKPFFEQVPPSTGWLGSLASLESRANFVDVRDTDCFLPFCNKLEPTSHSEGFAYYSDVKATNFEKFGWIATNPDGNEMIEFEVNLPRRPCYAIYVAVLRSYTGMGQFEVQVENLENKELTSVDLDGLWNPHISVWSDNQITQDSETGACTGRCKVRLTTRPQVTDRDGNKVKVLTLSARECSSTVVE